MDQLIAEKTGDEIGAYKLLEKLGEGGMGVVYEAEQRSLQRRVAIKVLPAEFSRDEEKAQRFRKEVLAVAALDHPGIVTIFEVGEFGGLQFYAMSLVSGGNLNSGLTLNQRQFACGQWIVHARKETCKRDQ